MWQKSFKTITTKYNYKNDVQLKLIQCMKHSWTEKSEILKWNGPKNDFWYSDTVWYGKFEN